MTTSLLLVFFLSVASLSMSLLWSLCLQSYTHETQEVQQSSKGWTHKLQEIVHQVTAEALTSFSWLLKINAGLLKKENARECKRENEERSKNEMNENKRECKLWNENERECKL